jgi:hypothetical protein
MRFENRKFSGSKGDAEVLRKLIEQARKAATMETADFAESLKAEIRIHHYTWIIQPLQNALDFIEGKTTRREAKKY